MVGASDALLLSEWHTLALVVCASVGFVLLTRREGLLELVGLVRVGDAQGVQVLGAPDLELGHVARLLDLDGASILPASRQEEILDFVYLLRLRRVRRLAGDSRDPSTSTTASNDVRAEDQIPRAATTEDRRRQDRRPHPWGCGRPNVRFPDAAAVVKTAAYASSRKTSPPFLRRQHAPSCESARRTPGARRIRSPVRIRILTIVAPRGLITLASRRP